VDRLEPRFPLEIRGSGLVGRGGFVFGLKTCRQRQRFRLLATNAFDTIDSAKIRAGNRTSAATPLETSRRLEQDTRSIAPEHGIEGAISGKCISVRGQFVPDFRHEMEMAAKQGTTALR
jgi:hypothetical protein